MLWTYFVEISNVYSTTQCEAGIARELAADPAYKNRAAGFNEAGNALDQHSPTFAGAAKHFCKGDPDSATRREIAELQAASSKLMNLFQGDSNASLLGAIENVARSIASLVEGAKSSAPPSNY